MKSTVTSDVSKTTTSSDTQPQHRYQVGIARKIENFWQNKWAKDNTYAAANPGGDLAGEISPNHKFILDMFPYPSGKGLHVGHPMGYFATDAYARYWRMQGMNVLHTMGFDAFGLPAEQYAIQEGIPPQITVRDNIARFTEQLAQLGLGHDTRRTVSTTDPQFYRWTQWIFLQIYNSWFDPEVGKARPISALIAQYESGQRTTEHGPYTRLTKKQQQDILNKHRLAYLGTSAVNWCPGLGTVLADEEVTSEGRSERGNFPVFTKQFQQWMMRITAYSDRLIDDLSLLDWPSEIKVMQTNWIGRSRGMTIDFSYVDNNDQDIPPITVFTTRPETLCGVSFLAVSPHHPCITAVMAEKFSQQWESHIAQNWRYDSPNPRQAHTNFLADQASTDKNYTDKNKKGFFSGLWVKHPLRDEAIPVFVADYVLDGYGTGAVMGVPGHDERDQKFAEQYDLPTIVVLESPEENSSPAGKSQQESYLVNSGAWNGQPVSEAKKNISRYLFEKGYGNFSQQYRLRDWVFARQRYWGEPFPLLYDAEGVVHAIPDTELPVELPVVDDYTPHASDSDDRLSQPQSPLSKAVSWKNVVIDLGEGQQEYTRETNTMPNWAGSCWYYLRYIDPHNGDAFCSQENEKYWLGPTKDKESGGVDLYVGGVEHAVLHLLYSRFWHKVLYDLGHVTSPEPFHKLVNQGLIQGFAYKDSRGAYVEASEVIEKEGGFYHNENPVTREFGKIGKSLRNTISPISVCEREGTDAFRLYIMGLGPVDQSSVWSENDIVGSRRFLQRLWRCLIDENTGKLRVVDQTTKTDQQILARTIAGVQKDYENLHFNSAIAKLTILVNHLTKNYPHGAPRPIVEPLVLLTAPLIPHIAEELWHRLGHEKTVTRMQFPQADPTLLQEQERTVPLQINGKIITKIVVHPDISTTELEEAARNNDKIKNKLHQAPTKVIVVPGKLVNFVVPKA